jgi:hypothetical protein
LHGRPTTLDLVKADVELVRRGLWNGMWHPTVKVQVKTTIDLRQEEDHFFYNLDADTYNVLCRDNESVRRILAVFRLPKRGGKDSARAKRYALRRLWGMGLPRRSPCDG